MYDDVRLVLVALLPVQDLLLCAKLLFVCSCREELSTPVVQKGVEANEKRVGPIARATSGAASCLADSYRHGPPADLIR